MVYCPECGSDDITRIGEFDYQCNLCGDVFDANEVPNNDDWFPADD